ncbi:MAG: DUF371 domain-containing protein [Candidatus Altarchaeum sp.]|nr:DUF371 domain-containing protein [Candidatus Altarchaeum sp.]
MEMFILPNSIREKFKTPYGKLFKNIEELRKFRTKFKAKFKNKFIICVGDVVSNSMLGDGWNINLCVYDNKTLRKEYKEYNDEKNPENFKGNEFIVWNPAGMLTEDAFEIVRQSLNFKHSKIFVDGEEDLFVIPCVKFCSPNTFLFYGQPNEGIVMVEINSAVQNDIENLFGKFYTGICEEVQAYGHENVLSKHKMTFEVTKDARLTKKGDCIIGVNADKGLADFSEKFKSMLKSANSSVRIFVICTQFRDEINAKGNENLILTNEEDIVVRKSKFIDDRTIAIMADKAAIDLNKEIVKALTGEKEKAKITLKFVVWNE